MSSIDTTAESQQEFRRGIQLQAVDEHLADDEIHDICRDLGHRWENRGQSPIYRPENRDAKHFCESKP